MKSLSLLIIFSAGIVLSSYSEDVGDVEIPGAGFLNNFEYEYSSFPQIDGNVTYGYVEYNYNINFSSSVRGKVETKTKDSDIDGMEGSLLVTKSKDIIVDI